MFNKFVKCTFWEVGGKEMLDKKITLMCAMRYALGRMTYVVSSVTNELIKNWDLFGKGDVEVMLREIREAIENGRAGMEMDIKRWNSVINHAISQNIKDANNSEVLE